MAKICLYEMPDISYHNGIVDIKRIRNAGCKRIGIRAGYGKNNVDQQYVRNAQACYNLNVFPLLYWFSYAYTNDMCRKEADYACDQAEKFWKKCPIAFDYEYDSLRYARTKGVNPTKEMVTNHAIAFLKRVKERGHIAVLYTNRDYMRNYFDMTKIIAAVGTVYVWYARYTSNLPANEKDIPDIWQYTSKGSLPGVNGNVDLNKVYVEFGDEIDDVIKNDKIEVSRNVNIVNFQRAANADGYKGLDDSVLIEDGIDGPNTQHARKRINAKAKKSAFGYEVGTTGSVVKWLQRRCEEILGIEVVQDGKFGKDTRKAVIKVQKKIGLVDDGIAGYDTIQALFYN